jgi:methyl-accepting chemotaxis protein
MRSIRTQFVSFAAIVVSVVAVGGYLNYRYMEEADAVERQLNTINQAIETHMSGTFFNEEGRAIAHGALGVYAFPAEERKVIYEKLRINNSDPVSAVKGYATRAQDAVRTNLARSLGAEYRENFEKHLAAFQAFHAEMDTALKSPPNTREEYVATILKLNTLRSRIGDFRKINSEALAKGATNATARRDGALMAQKRVLLATFVGIVLMLAGFLALMQRQFGGFSKLVAQALADFQSNRPLSVSMKAARTTEFALVASSLEAMQKQAAEMADIRSREAAGTEAQKERLRLLEEAVGDFRHSMRETMAAIDGSLRDMSATANDLTDTMQIATQGVNDFSRSSEQADLAATAVASASTEMAHSISSLSTRLRQTFDVVVETSRLARDTDQSVEQLDVSAQRIGEVISLIRAIAEQTNLLALNATIEAARAGEAGRGFSVVASEVKDLAARTAQATEEIASQIAEIQKTTSQSVASIRNIADSVRTAEGHTQEMSAVLDQQDSTIRSVAESAEASLQHTRAMREGTNQIETQISASRKTAEVVASATDNVRNASRHIDAAVARFLDRVAA